MKTVKENKKYSNETYIYNPVVANDILQMGFVPLKIGFNAKSQKTWVLFKYEDAKHYFDMIKA